MRFANKDKVQTLLSKKALLVDMRSPVHFRDSAIKGSVNLPLRNLVNTLITIKDKKTAVILFGLNSNDPEVKSGVTYSENLGFDTYVTDLRQLQE